MEKHSVILRRNTDRCQSREVKSLIKVVRGMCKMVAAATRLATRIAADDQDVTSFSDEIRYWRQDLLFFFAFCLVLLKCFNGLKAFQPPTCFCCFGSEWLDVAL